LLDSFKISLGLPTNMPIELDHGELERLRSATLQEIGYTREEASQIALTRRLDLANSLDAVADAERKLAVAEDNLGPDLDLVLRSSIGTEPDTKFLDFTRSQSSYSAGLELSLPLDRKSERNQYRRAFITLDRARRAYELEHDRVLQDINNAWRGLTQARQSYEIQLKSVEIAETRADATAMMMDAGRAIIRDVLDAQASLLRARNTLTQAIVDYRISMLEMWRDMGTLTFKDGQFQEETPNVEGSGNS
jgi:outer membrane protein TolC